MPKLDVNAGVSTARTWATSHLVAAAIIACAVGFVLGLIVG